MTWIKQGLIFNLEHSPNRSTHAQVPTPYVMTDRIRIYYACRNNGKAFVAYFDLSFDLKTILKVHEEPIFTQGKPGMFDADGAMPSCVIENNGELWMYYIGWNSLRGDMDNQGARYQNEIGIAVSKDDGETFERMYDGSIIGRFPTEPGLAVMPFIIKDFIVVNGVKLWEMWYQSGTGWHLIDGKYEPTYVIKRACSSNGICWVRCPDKCLEYTHSLEAFSRPCVVKKKDHLSMWYCYRDSKNYRGGNGSYRIGYARSSDERSFVRFDSECDLQLGKESEFDSKMQCYPYVINYNGEYIMFYNGNDFGQTGIGLAKWKY